jgi:outer membrane protein TolC
MKWGMALLIALLMLGTFPERAFAASGEVHELTLEECLELAEKNSPRLKLAQVALDQAKLGLKEARSRKKSIDEAEEALEEIKGVPSEDETRAAELQAAAAQLASFDVQFFKENGLWQAEQQLALAQASYDLAGEGVRLAVKRAYYDLLKAEADLALAEAAEREAAEFQRATAAQAKVGMATPAQLLAAETALAQARAGRLAAESAREAKRLALLKEIGLDLNTAVKLTPAPVEKEEFDLEKTVAQALENSLEIKAAAFQKELADRRFDLTKRWYPEITYKYKGAEYEALSAALKLTDTRLAVETSVRSSYNLLLAAYEQLGPARKAVDQAKENLRLAQAKLKVGAATQLDVLQAERALAQARSNLTGVEQSAALAAASLRAAALGLSLSSGQGSTGVASTSGASTASSGSNASAASAAGGGGF